MAHCDRCGAGHSRSSRTICHDCEGFLQYGKQDGPKSLDKLHVNTTKEEAPDRYVGRDKFGRHKWQKRYNPKYFVDGKVLHAANGIVAGAALQQAIEKRMEFEDMQGKPRQLVKNGKPTCAEGAKLLGVPWKE